MVLTGYARCLAHDLTPATIIAPDRAASGDPALLAAHCLEQIDPTLVETVQAGDMLVLAGRLHAPAPADETTSSDDAIFALQALGFAALLCQHADAELAARSGSYGLPVLVQPAATAALASGALLRLDLLRGTLRDQTSGASWQTAPCSPAVLAAVQRAQLLQRMRRVVEDEGYAE
jgi:3-isopropylmalate/(R)-2-methylmalate dehydratase small subunit